MTTQNVKELLNRIEYHFIAMKFDDVTLDAERIETIEAIIRTLHETKALCETLIASDASC